MEVPQLIEPYVKDFLFGKLKSCHEYKTNTFSLILNTVIFVIFAIILFLVLYFSRNQQLTPYEKQQKMRKEQEYVVSKIRDYKEMHKANSTFITNLPVTN